MVRARVAAANHGRIPVLNISFIKTLRAFRTVWMTLALIQDLLPPRSRRLLLRRVLEMLVAERSPPRRLRSCPRAVRQPIHKWPRLLRNSSASGRFAYTITPVTP